MPTYQYVCTDCGDALEVVQKFSDDALTTHEVCGGKLRKVFSPVGIVFKGSGFYRTDSRNGSGASSKASGTANSSDKAEKTDKADKSEKSTTPAKSESSTTSTPAASGASGSSSKVALSPAA